MYTYIYMNTHTYISIYIYIYIHTHTHVYAYTIGRAEGQEGVTRQPFRAACSPPYTEVPLAPGRGRRRPLCSLRLASRAPGRWRRRRGGHSVAISGCHSVAYSGCDSEVRLEVGEAACVHHCG